MSGRSGREPGGRAGLGSKLVSHCLGAAFVWVAAVPAPVAEATDRRPSALVLFTARMLDNSAEEIVTFDDLGLRDAYLAGVGVSRRVGRRVGSIDLEIEGQVVRHFRGQTHWEFNGAVVGRWSRFPWNTALPTSLAYGVGPSYAMETPSEEVARLDTTERLLIYWLAELEIGLPDRSWSTVARIHHRSGGFGAVADKGGSNWVTLGVRWRF